MPRVVIEEEVDYPNLWSETLPSKNPDLPKSLGCLSYTPSGSPYSPLALGFFSRDATTVFPDTYKDLSKIFLSHFRLQRQVDVTINASDRKTLLDSSPFVALRRYRSDIDKLKEKLESFVESEYNRAFAGWKTGELQNLQREKAVKAGTIFHGKDFETRDGKAVSAEEMVEIKLTTMAFRKEQENRHLSIISTALLRRDTLIIDTFQLWDSLIVRDLITDNDIAESEVRGVILVWKAVPKEAVVSCEPIFEKHEKSKVEKGGHQEIEFTTKPSKLGSLTGSNPGHRLTQIRLKLKAPEVKGGSRFRRDTEEFAVKAVEETTIVPITGTKSSKMKQPMTSDHSTPMPTKRARMRPETPIFVPTNLARTQSSTRHISRITPSQSTQFEKTPSRSTRKAATPASSTKKFRKVAFEVNEILDHAWGYWEKKRGVFVRDGSGTLFREYLIRWDGGGYEPTWEPELNLGTECLENYWDACGIEPGEPPAGYSIR